MFSRIIASSFLVFQLFPSVCHGSVETCEELQAAFDLTKTQDVVVDIYPNVDIDCRHFTTMTMDSNTLTVKASEYMLYGKATLREVRFNVTNGARLSWEPSVEFYGTGEKDVNGGGVFVGERSTARFLEKLSMIDVGVLSVTDEGSDFTSSDLSGGCVYADGYFRVDGDATFTRCDVSGGGESPPGPGGALYVGKQGSVVFNGALEISDSFVTDNEGNSGAGIYNAGKVTIRGNAKFESLGADLGGAIYNAVGAQFKFGNMATAMLIDCTTSVDADSIGGALFNDGYFKFSGQALFVNSDAPSIYVSSTGEIVLSENSVFWENELTDDPAILVASGGGLVVPSTVTFVDNVVSECSTVYYEKDGTCL